MRQVIQVLAAFLMVIPMPVLEAQGLSSPVRLEGQRVRVRVSSETGRTLDVDGTIATDRPDTITVIEPSGRIWSVPRANVQQIDINRGRDHVGGALKGAVMGAVFGLLFGMTEIDCDGEGYGYDCKGDGSRPSRVEYAASAVGVFAEFGAMVGGVIGVQTWEPVAVRQQGTVAPPTHGIGWRIKF